MKYTSFTFILILAILAPISSQARLDIVPQKVVIEPRERGGEFTILNLFNQKGNFRIELLNYRQDENGVYQELKGPLDPDFDPEKIVRFSPRQFSLEPGGRQKVRLSLRKPANLPEGEYRFHIKATRFADEDNSNTNSDKPAVKVSLNVGVAIPVIVRHGNVVSDAKILNPQITSAVQNGKQVPQLEVDIAREGNASAIGQLEVFWQPQNGETRKIGNISNANVFTEINQRNFKIPLGEMPTGNGQILVRYSDEVNKGKVIDEITLQR